MTLEGTPLHEPFIALLWIVIGIPVGLIILSAFLALLTAKVMAISIVLAVAGAMVLYIAGVIALTFTWVYEQLTGRPAPWTVISEPETLKTEPPEELSKPQPTYTQELARLAHLGRTPSPRDLALLAHQSEGTVPRNRPTLSEYDPKITSYEKDRKEPT